jgi:hypothetical protein
MTDAPTGVPTAVPTYLPTRVVTNNDDREPTPRSSELQAGDGSSNENSRPGGFSATLGALIAISVAIALVVLVLVYNPKLRQRAMGSSLTTKNTSNNRIREEEDKGGGEEGGVQYRERRREWIFQWAHSPHINGDS